MRTAARLKLGYYPLPNEEAMRIRRFLSFSAGSASVLDPCTGTGAAFLTITVEANVLRYGIELDANRVREAKDSLCEVIQGNALDTHSLVVSFFLFYLNPPFVWEMGPGRKFVRAQL